jgi:hypothetical protein
MKPLRTMLTMARERSCQFGITEHPIHRCAKILDRIGVDMNGASPVTSGKQELFELMTGVPAAIACTTGSPKPS